MKHNPETHPSWYHPDAALGSAVRYIASLNPFYHWVGIYLLKGNFLELGPYLGEKALHTRIAIGKGICGTAVAQNKDLNVPDVSKATNTLSCSIKTKSELVVLIKDRKQRILGQIDIDSHVLAAFTEQDETEIKKIANELGRLWPKQIK